MATVAERLVEAEAAYHQLVMGGQIASVTDSSGERIQYTSANASRLLAYIAQLKAELAGQNAARWKRPLRPVWR